MEDPLPSQSLIDGTMLLVDKPQAWTSFDVVNKIRISLKHNLGLKNIKVGHAGTLDPMATGLLIICTGKSTKKLSEYQGQPKEYEGTITLGATTPSYDAESEPDAHFPVDHITAEALEKARLSFIGDLSQMPPMFSAIKVDGQPLYKKARQGIVVEVSPRPVTIYEFDFTNIALPLVGFRVRCSKGTYIRSLAFDFGKALGSGGYLSELRRTKIGNYKVENAWELEELVEHIESLAESPIL
jgi:tRNA pseudouridine55 synthase